jgi:hypothetical protein
LRPGPLEPFNPTRLDATHHAITATSAQDILDAISRFGSE